MPTDEHGFETRKSEMTLSFAIIAGITVGAAVAAMGLRNPVHCVLSVTLAFAGLAAAYLQLDAQFVGFAQILVYIGAVAILIVFAILLTRGSQPPQPSLLSAGWQSGIIVALLVLGALVYALVKTPALPREIPPAPNVTVRQIGDALMHRFVLPLEAVGLLLTAALIGAVIIAMKEPEPGSGNRHPETERKESGTGAQAEAPNSISNPKAQSSNHA
jgi:NADH-quinone oxidoreductase subunit J